jgi:hypothetical protein
MKEMKQDEEQVDQSSVNIRHAEISDHVATMIKMS